MFTAISLLFCLTGCGVQAPKPSANEPPVQQLATKEPVPQELAAVQNETGHSRIRYLPQKYLFQVKSKINFPVTRPETQVSFMPKRSSWTDNKRDCFRGSGQFLCSPTGNCPYWIFRKPSDGYTQEIEGSALAVSVKKGKTKFPELLSQQHGSATDSELRLYEFGGTSYHLTKCMDKSYVDPNDIGRVLDEPILSEIPASGCN